MPISTCVGTSANAFGRSPKHSQNWLEIAGIEEFFDVTWLLKQSVNLTTKKRAVTRGTLVKRNLLNFHASCVSDKLHCDAFH